MIHYTTKNISFKKMYYLLETMGIENNTFFLELYDETLLNVDPLDEENLTDDQKLRVIREIMRNPYYFFREIVRIPTAGTKIPFELTRATLAITWSILMDLSSVDILPRQSFKTFTVAITYDWLFYWGCKNTEFSLFSYDSAILESNLARIKAIRDNLPSYLNMYDPRRDKDNVTEMKYVTNEFYNWIRIKAPGKSKDEATKIGRGLSTACVWYDEPAFIPNIQHQYESAVFAYKTVARLAKVTGSRHHRIMTTTPGYLSTDEGRWMFNFINNSCDFSEKMYDYSVEQIKQMIQANSLNGFLHIEYMYYDLGKGDDYLEEMSKDNISEEAFRREVLLQWGEGEGNHPLGNDILPLLQNNIRIPEDTIVINDIYLLKLYKKIEEIDFNAVYVGGVDCGGNVLRDFSVITILDPKDYSVLGVLRTNSYSTAKFSKALAYIMIKLFPNIILVPERNSMGIAIIDSILEEWPFLESNIYHDQNGKPGFHNDKNIRPLLYETILKQAVTDSLDKIKDRNILKEILGLTVTRTGRIDHGPNGHDDTLMSYLFTRWFLNYAPNKSQYIDPKLIGVNNIKENLDEIDKKRRSILTSVDYKAIIFGNSGGTFTKINSDGTIDRDINRKTAMSNEISNNQEDFINKMVSRYKDLRGDSSMGEIRVLTSNEDVDTEEIYDKTEEEVQGMFSSSLGKKTKYSDDSLIISKGEVTNKNSYQKLSDLVLR